MIQLDEGVTKRGETVDGNQGVFSYRGMTWTLFTLLMLVAPAPLFLIMAIQFMPAIFFAGGIIFMIPKVVNPAHTSETLVFMGLFAVHLVIVAGGYILISLAVAKLLHLIRDPKGRNRVFIILCLAVACLALLPVYGSGGHGPMRWGSLLDLFGEVNSGYGPYAVVLVYGVGFAAIAWRFRRVFMARS